MVCKTELIVNTNYLVNKLLFHSANRPLAKYTNFSDKFFVLMNEKQLKLK